MGIVSSLLMNTYTKRQEYSSIQIIGIFPSHISQILQQVNIGISTEYHHPYRTPDISLSLLAAICSATDCAATSASLCVEARPDRHAPKYA